MSTFTDQPIQSQETGSFWTGFTVGIFAGAAGYFLFATDKGSGVRQELTREWTEAKTKWNEGQPAEEVAASSLKHWWERLSSALQVAQKETESTLKTRPAARKKAKLPAKPTSKFKNSNS